VNQNGLTSPLPVYNAGWAGEIALDMDMVSATCPNCKILLVEANSAYPYDLGPAVNTAVSLGAIAVSNSYGQAEFSGETSYDAYYNHPGVAITVSTADCGYFCSGMAIGDSWPSASPNVVAVGGTSLVHDTSTRGWTESAWGSVAKQWGAGSGCSKYESKPSWQHDSGCLNRTQADVSAVADPATGVAIYSADFSVGGWNVYGGTSASSPIIAAVYALAGAPAAGAYPASYLYADTADLYDVIGGSNDIWEPTIACTVTYLCNGVAGYDGPTGLGTPNGIGAFADSAAATILVVSGLTTPRTAGVAGRMTVTARDTYGNTATGYSGTVHFTSSDGAAVLPANTTLAAGVGTFSVTLRTAGTQSVTATDTLTASITGVESGIVVNPAAATTLVVSGLTTPRTAGSAGSIRVTAVDAYGNRIHSYLGTVHFTSSDPQAKLPASYTFTAADAGTHVFSVTIKTAGTQSVTATDTKTATIKGSQAGIVVNPAALKTLVVSGLTTPRTAGTAGSIRVTAVDAYGNRIHGYLGTVHFTSTDAKAKLPANYTFTAADAGTHVFSGNVILKTAGTQSVTATDTLTASIKGAQAGIVVNPAAVKTLVVSGLTTPRTKGVAGSLRVTAVDAYGNRVHSYLGTVHFTSTDAKAKLPANYKFTAADAGTHVFIVTLKTAGTRSVTATDKVTTTITGVQSGIVVK
jgi:hypothetical protein